MKESHVGPLIFPAKERSPEQLEKKNVCGGIAGSCSQGPKNPRAWGQGTMLSAHSGSWLCCQLRQVAHLSDPM